MQSGQTSYRTARIPELLGRVKREPVPVWEPSAAVENCCRGLEVVDDVVDGAALAGVAVRGAEEDPLVRRLGITVKMRVVIPFRPLKGSVEQHAHAGLHRHNPMLPIAPSEVGPKDGTESDKYLHLAAVAGCAFGGQSHK